MPWKDFIETRIVVNGQPLKEYQDPDNDDNVRYIQAIAGQTFMVEVTFLPGFNLRWAPYLYCEFWTDDADIFHYYRRPSQSVSHRKGVLSKELKIQYDGARFKKDDGQWTTALLTFGALGIGKRVIRRTTDH